MRDFKLQWMIFGLFYLVSQVLGEELNDSLSRPIQKGLTATCETLNDPAASCAFSLKFSTNEEATSLQTAWLYVGASEKFISFTNDRDTPYYYNFEVNSGDEIIIEYTPEQMFPKYWVELFDAPEGSGNILNSSRSLDFIVLNECLTSCVYSLLKTDVQNWEPFTFTVYVNDQIEGSYGGEISPLNFNVNRGDTIRFLLGDRSRRDLTAEVHNLSTGALVFSWLQGSYYFPMLANNPCTIPKPIGSCTYSLKIFSRYSFPFSAIVNVLINGVGKPFTMTFDPSSLDSYYNFGVVSGDQITIEFDPTGIEAGKMFSLFSEPDGQGSVLLISNSAEFPVQNPCLGSCTYSIVKTSPDASWGGNTIRIFVNSVESAIYTGGSTPVTFNVSKGDKITFTTTTNDAIASANILDTSDSALILLWVSDSFHSPLLAFNPCRSSLPGSPFAGKLYPILLSQLERFLSLIASAESTIWIEITQ